MLGSDSHEGLKTGMTMRTGVAIALTALLLSTGVAADSGTQRLLFLGPNAPRMIVVEVSSGRFSIDQTRRRYAAGLFARLDQDGDGRLNGSEAAAIPVEGRLAARGTRFGARWTSLDVAPADEFISLEELLTHLDDALGPAIAIVKAPPKQTQTVRLYRDLDRDDDGRVSADEVEDGLATLLAFDFDDDETLSVAELQPFPLSVLQAMQAEEAQEEPVPLLQLNTPSEISLAADRCITQYGVDGELSKQTATAIGGRQTRRYDRDRNGGWNRDELVAYLTSARPDVTLSVSLAPDFVKIDSGRAQRSVELDFGGVAVEWRTFNNSWQVQQGLIPLLKTTRFAEADGDDNDYLGPAEFLGLQAGDVDFETVDLDGNEQVTREEIGDFFTLDGLASQSRLILSVSDEATTLFEILDETKDYRITPREIREASRHLLEFDLNGDAALVPGELSSQFAVTFTQPQLVQIDPRRNSPAGQQLRAIVTEQTSGPLWFRRMDRNLDEEISWREFLGPRTDFEQLDADNNGVINYSEAEQTEQLRGIHSP